MAKKRTAKAARPRKSAHRRSADRSVERRQGRAAAAIEEVRRGPLEPEIPLDPQAPLGPVDPDALEVLHDTQALAADAASDETEVGPTATDKARAIVLAGGDVDAAGDGDVGEETVGGSTPTPDQDVVDDLGRAVGVTYADSEPLRPEEKERQRDEERWEVDPASSEDYVDRVREFRRHQKKAR